MEHYVVSARKYRPAIFDEVVGQEAITSTLQKAIANNHLAQALLFCGPRGVGKTTCARILARAINADSATGPDEDFAFNIFELDAASNNSVEDIRSLIDQVRFAPQQGRYKVYIIDEVHMLSQAAFNAFLKTLEEPPAHAIFILATTEKHKIIPTILSRCQIFDFKRIQVKDTVGHLRSIATREGITVDDDALHIVAEKADGALRDALSIFDRLVTFSGNVLSYKDVLENLNVLDYEYYFRTTDLILKGDVPQTLLVLDEVLSNGFNALEYLNGLASHFRNLLVCRDAATVRLLEVGENVASRYGQQAQQCSPVMLIEGLKVLNEADVQYRASRNQRLTVELALMRLCQPQNPALGVPDGAPEKKNDLRQGDGPAATPAARPAAAASATPLNEGPSDGPPVIPLGRTMPLAGGNVSRPTVTVSINRRKPEEHTEVAVEEMPHEPFSETEMQEAWEQRVRSMFRTRPGLLRTLTRRPPRLRDGNTIELVIDNKSQNEEVELNRTELLEQIRKDLRNYSVNLATVIEHVEHRNPVLSTDKEKYAFLLSQNPELEALRKALELDLDI
jgi:DNA polymerase-3 subunit gamma/tau